MNTYSNCRCRFLVSRSSSCIVFFPLSLRDKSRAFILEDLWAFDENEHCPNLNSIQTAVEVPHMIHSYSDLSIFSSWRCQQRHLWNKNWKCGIWFTSSLRTLRDVKDFTSVVIICILLLSRGVMHHKYQSLRPFLPIEFVGQEKQ